MKKSIEERAQQLLARRQNALQGSDHLWRYPIAEAALALIRAGKPVTIDSLIERLGVPPDASDPTLGGRALSGAIDRLQKLRSEMDGDHKK
jgi:hypothetical protein